MGKNNSKKLDKKTKVKKVPVIMGIIIIAIIIGLIFVFFNNKNNKGNNSDVGIYTDVTSQDTSNTNIKTLEDGSKENISTKIKGEKTFEGLTITNVVFKTKNGETTFTAKVENKSDKDFKASPVTIIFTDKNGKELWQLGAYIDDTVKGSESLINAIANADITDAYDYSIKYKVN